jgi:hypothetical protein
MINEVWEKRKHFAVNGPIPAHEPRHSGAAAWPAREWRATRVGVVTTLVTDAAAH